MVYSGEDLWSRTLLIYDSALKEINTKIEILNNEFKLKHQYNPIEHVSSRLKSPESIAKKLKRRERDLTIENVFKYVNDVAGVRIICSFTSDIYKIAELIAKQSDVKVIKVKDYISAPKPNGYMSYHMILTIPIFLSNKIVNTKVEIQIRTIAMDFWASLEHKMYYKFEGNSPEHIRRELKECADIVSFLDRKMLSINEEIQTYKNEQEVYQNKSEAYQEEFIEASYEATFEATFEATYETRYETTGEGTGKVTTEEAAKAASEETSEEVAKEAAREASKEIAKSVDKKVDRVVDKATGEESILNHLRKHIKRM